MKIAYMGEIMNKKVHKTVKIYPKNAYIGKFRWFFKFPPAHPAQQAEQPSPSYPKLPQPQIPKPNTQTQVTLVVTGIYPREPPTKGPLWPKGGSRLRSYPSVVDKDEHQRKSYALSSHIDIACYLQIMTSEIAAAQLSLQGNNKRQASLVFIFNKTKNSYLCQASCYAACVTRQTQVESYAFHLPK